MKYLRNRIGRNERSDAVLRDEYVARIIATAVAVVATAVGGSVVLTEYRQLFAQNSWAAFVVLFSCGIVVYRGVFVLAVYRLAKGRR